MEGFDHAQVYLSRNGVRTLMILNTDGEIDEYHPARPLRNGWFNMEKLCQFSPGDVCYLTLDSEEVAIVIEARDGLQALFLGGTL